MKNITLANAAMVCRGTLYGMEEGSADLAAREASCVVIDSRKMEKGGIFIATKGEKVLQEAAFRPGGRDYWQCRQDQYQGIYCRSSLREVLCAENTGEL